MEKPCSSKDVLNFNFNFENLVHFLDFLETKNKESNNQISEIKIKVGNVELTCNSLKQQIPIIMSDFEKKIKTLSDKFDAFGEKMNVMDKSVHKLQEFEARSKDKIEKIPLIQDELAMLHKTSEDTKKKIERLQYQHLQLNNEFIKKTSEFESSINILNAKAEKVPIIERDLKEVKEKMMKKFSKYKEKSQKTNNKIVEIETSLNQIYNYFPSLKGGNTNMNINKNDNKNDDNRQAIEFGYDWKKDYNEFVEEMKRFKDSNEKEVKDIKQYLSGMKKIDFDDKKNPRDDKNQLHSSINDINVSINELQNNEKFFISAISGKAGREELEKTQKTIQQEIEKLNQKITKNSKEITAITVKIEEEKTPEVKKEDNIVSMMGGVEEVKRVMIETIRESELVLNLKQKQGNNEDELLKLNEQIIEIQKILKEELSNPKLIDFKDVLNRLTEIENNERYFKSMIDELKGDDPSPDTIIKTPVMNNISFKNPPIQRKSTMKDFFIETTVTLSQYNDRLDRLNNRIDSMNKEILEKVKRDLLLESNKILDEFRLDLKFSISKIEEQMREKVDKFNMEEFTRKFEKKMLLEINTKIDRVDLKKNNTLINKKIEGLENKISKTLVDTLIDLQMDDAPLIVKKSMAGSDKCASCNQNLPINFMNHTHCVTDINNVINQKPMSKTMKIKNKSVDKTNLDQMKNVNSSGFFNNLPDINNTDKRYKTNVNSPRTSITKPKVQTNFNNSFRKYDELAERQLNSYIKEELDKNIVNPEKLIKAGKKVYDTIIDKKR